MAQFLTAEEEQALVTRVQAHGDRKAADALIRRNISLIVKFARRYWNASRSGGDLSDFVQEAMLGYLRGIEKYDPSHDARLNSYAAWWMRAYLIRHSIKVSAIAFSIGDAASQRKVVFGAGRAEAALLRAGLPVTDNAVAQALAVPITAVRAVRAAQNVLPLDATHGEGRTSLHEVIPDPNQLHDERLAEHQILRRRRAWLRTVSRHLSPRERTILARRHLRRKPQTLSEISVLFGVSRERVRQIEKHMLEKLARLAARASRAAR